jgi:murein DD-endopeptidase MepM/ murein hydrolase activator NlpD
MGEEDLMNWPQLLVRLAATRAAQQQQNRRKGVLGITAGLASVGALGIMVALSAVAAATMRGPASAGATATGIPPIVFAAYLAAETNAHTIDSGCEVHWPFVAGIWKVESGHATSGGATIDETGQVTPPIYGVVLDGSTPGTAAIADTDDGVLDGNNVWDRAVGPAQFLPASWRSHGQDGNSDGVADPQNVYDAALSTVAYLCQRTPGNYQDPAHLARAIRGYNNSAEYIENVTGWINHYRAFAITGGGVVTADGQYGFPLPHESVTLEELRRSHHDYPASDLMVPEGTPIYAAHPGTIANLYQPCPDCKCGYGVTVTGLDEHRYTYCHGQTLASQLEVGVDVVVGQMLMLSGNTGNSTAPHLHFQIRNPTGDLVCPQPLLESWWTGTALTPLAAPTDGCTH